MPTWKGDIACLGVCVVMLLVAGASYVVTAEPTHSQLPTSTIINVIDLGEHPYYGFPPNADVQPATEEAYWTHLLRVWSDGTCETAVMVYEQDGTWSMTAWTHPSQP